MVALLQDDTTLMTHNVIMNTFLCPIIKIGKMQNRYLIILTIIFSFMILSYLLHTDRI